MNFIYRLLVAIIAIPFLIWLIIQGNLYLLVLLLVLTLTGTYEMTKMIRINNKNLSKFILIPSAIVLVSSSLNKAELSLFAVILTFILFTFFDIVKGRLQFSLSRASTLLLVIFYPGFLFSYIYRLRHDFSVNGDYFGISITLSVIVLIWISDSFAYFVGMTLGKHRGLLKSSPKKSLEGFFGGLVTPFIAVMIYYYFSKDIALRYLLFSAMAAGIFGQIGDLIESILKRDCGIKDSSNLIPGHGGILDRFDSILIAIPILYYCVRFF
ncbi:MAG: phosphatidate cytidylyltransferase [Candidatus Cloacimonetes bacterium]|nr:phosphatidate cytidylyltransferase [Candidatus Cloacimonadota bacterium]